MTGSEKKFFWAELLLPSVDIDALPQISSQASVQVQPSVVNDSLNTLPFLPVSPMPVPLSSVNGLSSLNTAEEHVASAGVQPVVVQQPLLEPVTDYCSSITSAEVDPSSINTVLSPARNVSSRLVKQRKQSGSIVSFPVDSSSAENDSSPISSVSAVISPARHSNGRPVRSNSGVSFNQRKQNESLNVENGSANVASVSCDVGNQWCTPRQSVSISQARRAYSANSDMFISDVKQKIGESNLVSVRVAPFVKASATKIHVKSSSGRKQRSDVLTPSERVIIDAAIAENHAHWGHAVDTQCDDELDLNQAFAVIADYNAGTNTVRPCAFAARAVSISSAELVPIPSDKCKEIPLRQALRDNGEERLAAATLIEINKQQGIGCLSKSDIFSSKDELPAGSIVVDAHVLYKLKADGRETCRIAAMGNRLPPLPNSLTFASVVNESSKMFCVAAMQAHCAKRQEDLIFSDADVVGVFLHIPLNSPVPLYLKLPKNLPHPLAGKLIRVLGAIYGLQESNRLFSNEMTRTIVEDAGFTCTNVDKQVFIKQSKADPGLKCITCITVDDAAALSNHQEFVDDLFSALSARFGPLTINVQCKLHTGLEFTILPNKAILVTQDRAIARAAGVVGISHLAHVDVPVEEDFLSCPLIQCFVHLLILLLILL